MLWTPKQFLKKTENENKRNEEKKTTENVFFLK